MPRPDLPFGAIRDALHVVIDMQRLFAEATAWQVPDLPRILPGVAALLDHAPGAAAFARFVPPANAGAAQGMWQGYYRTWDSVTGDRLAPGMVDVLPDLMARVPGAPMLDKTGYCVFSSPAFAPLLAERKVTTLILSGVETDVCVLSTVMEAVDRGLRVIVAADGVASGSRDGHDAALAILRARFDLQVEIAPVADIMAEWSAR